MDETTDGLETFPLEPGDPPKELTLLRHVDWMDAPPEARGTGYVVIDHEPAPRPRPYLYLVSERKSWRDRLIAKWRSL